MREVIRTLTMYGRTYALVRDADCSTCGPCALLRCWNAVPMCVGGIPAMMCWESGHFIELPGERGSE
jgi:hypothetical protein